MDETAWIDTPRALREAYADFDWDIAYRYPEQSLVYRLSREGAPRLFLKLARVGHHPTLADEADRMRWARAHLPVPEVVAQGSDGDVAWLVTTPLPGRDGTDPGLLRRPAELARTLARGLRRFHDDAPVRDCPFDFRLDAAIEHVRARMAEGLIDAERDFHHEFAHLTVEGAVALLESERPAPEELVVCHGDYCVPNILVEEGRATGYVDLGELGVADRWWDLAAATWSLEWNLGPGFEELFLKAYGAAPDPDRRWYYRLLYDLAS